MTAERYLDTKEKLKDAAANALIPWVNAATKGYEAMVRVQDTDRFVRIRNDIYNGPRAEVGRDTGAAAGIVVDTILDRYGSWTEWDEPASVRWWTELLLQMPRICEALAARAEREMMGAEAALNARPE